MKFLNCQQTNVLACQLGGAFFIQKSTEKIKNHTKYTLEHPEHESKEFDFPTFDTKVLADIKVLKVKAFEISANNGAHCPSL